MGVIINTEAPNTKIIYDVNNLSVAQNTFYDTGITYDSIKDKYKYLVIQLTVNTDNTNSYMSNTYVLVPSETQFRTAYYTSQYIYLNNASNKTGMTVGAFSTLQIRVDIISYTYTLKGVKVIGVA